MSKHKVERRTGFLYVDGELYANASYAIVDAECDLAQTQSVLARNQAILDFLRAEQDEELARKLWTVYGSDRSQAEWERLARIDPDQCRSWLNVARAAREHFGGEQ